jgi:transposase
MPCAIHFGSMLPEVILLRSSCKLVATPCRAICRQVYDWRKKLPTGQLVMLESVVALPMFAELIVEEAAAGAEVPAEAVAANGVEIVVGDVVIRVGVDADKVLLTRSIRAARAAAS